MMGFVAITHGQADSSTTVAATVKLSVCGDEIVEGPEDCEGSDINGKTCSSIGFGGGDLTCDIACSFDTTACLPPTPTPTPSSTPTPVPTATPATSPAAASAPSSTQNDTAESSQTATVPIAVIAPSPVVQPALPVALRVFDINDDGIIHVTNLHTVVKIWVDDWKNYMTEFESESFTSSNERNACDVNYDRHCDLKDFSVLMYYVEGQQQ